MEHLFEILEKNDYKNLREELIKLHVADIAAFIENLPSQKTPDVFRILPKDMSADVFSFLQPDQKKEIITSITDGEISHIMQDMFTDDAVDFLEEMPAVIVKKVLAVTDKKSRDKINEFLQFKPGSGGSIMTSEFVNIKKETTVKEALKLIRNVVLDKETVYTLYVISSDRKLLGGVPLRTLLASDDNTKAKDIMTSAVFAYTADDQKSITEKIKKYDLISIPVVDSEERLCGIITVDDAIDVIEEEATKDVEKMSGLKPSDKAYLETGVFKLSRNRIIWLTALMLTLSLTSFVMQGFEHVIAVMLPLTFFVPMVIGTAGNAGSQASALIIRGLATGELKPKDFFKILWKELRVAFICGLVLAAINFLRVYFFGGITLPYNAFDIALIVSITLVVVVTLAKIIGAMLPIIASKFKLDPATMSAPVVVTIMDIAGLAIYFSIAMAFV